MCRATPKAEEEQIEQSRQEALLNEEPAKDLPIGSQRQPATQAAAANFESFLRLIGKAESESEQEIKNIIRIFKRRVIGWL